MVKDTIFHIEAFVFTVLPAQYTWIGSKIRGQRTLNDYLQACA